ncbi:probable polygalacturonase At3g15720 [Vitis riparia]|uniref:probable polygalacturonase At3g15720 n=1 Tax=Vitis riparia TaxID=96939 RepID=UPI00155A9579|nr:probable polygalacturonase At3g15720 [Vitis riparia]
MAPFEGLYGRKFRSPICWDDVGERKLLGPELVQLIVEKVALIKERLKTAQSRQKSYVDNRRRDLEFEDRFSFFILCMVTLSSFSSTTNASSPLYDVMNYGAVGDRKTDDSQAFLKAWNETYNVQQQCATLNVPAKTFLLNPIEFSGPCVPTSIEFQVAGKIIASTNKSLFENNHWILFSYVKGLTLTGSGTIDGQGAGSWQDRTRVPALKIYTCPDLVLQGLTHINPQKAHIILTKCDGANINNITISAPEDAPNTDGIDIGGSNHVRVQKSKYDMAGGYYLLQHSS